MIQNDRVVSEKAVLVGLNADCFKPEDTATYETLDELEALLETAGGTCVAKVLQNRHTPDPHSFIGEGKAQEICTLLENSDANLVIFDNDLSPSQIRALEELTGATVLDRSALILDIFAQRAKTAEGRLQVELAQYQYLLPKLSGMGKSMSRLGGGIGTRGPGETRLEMDRRRIRRRMSDLRREIKELEDQRSLRRSRREKNRVPVVALVGYTNAGKSTLLNALSDANVLAEDKLFATLDPVVRTVKLPSGGEFLLVDTVGFISKLPHALVDAFRSTLEEALLADILLIVSDGASEEMLHQHDVVLEVLSSLGAQDRPMIDVVNKVDLLENRPEWPGAFFISAKTGEGVEALLEEVKRRIRGVQRRLRVQIPYAQGALTSMLHSSGSVLSEEYTDSGAVIEAMADDALYGRLAARLGEDALTWLE